MKALAFSLIFRKGFRLHIPYNVTMKFDSLLVHKGNVEKSRQRRSRPFAVLTYWKYAPRTKRAAALLDGLF